MNNKLFRTVPGAQFVPADTTNEAGGAAYSRTPEEALAQFAATGCFGDTFYVKDDEQLKTTLELAAKCSPEWIAKCALYSRESGLMKDMPAVLCAVLATRNVTLLKKVFERCINNGKMLRNFVQAVRSGVTGRKSFGTAVKRMLQWWFESRTDEQLFHASIGEKPSLGDIIKMCHPKPKTEARRLMFAYLMGKDVIGLGLLPGVVREFEAAKLGAGPLPDINFQFLSSLQMTTEQWSTVCDRASWQTLRMNLNTFQRHECFVDTERLGRVIARLRDKDEIKRARQMPHQLFSAYLHVNDDVPPGIRMAIGEAVEHALENIPALPANLVIGIDTSGSMRSPVTGARGSATSKMTCVQTAALIGCAMRKRCPTARIVAFDTQAHTGKLPNSVAEAAQKLATFGGGGTDCSIPLQLAAQMPKCEAVVIVSDNESWFDSARRSPTLYGYASHGTNVMEAWRRVQAKNPSCKLVCIDLTPNTTRQTTNEANVLNVGGFSDAVFDVVASFFANNKSWVEVIQAVDIQGDAR